MLDLIKKAALAGVGAASLTVEKAEELAKELVDKGKITEREGRKFVSEMQDRAEESKEELKKHVENTVEQVLEKMNLAQANEVEEIKQELSSLRTELEELKKN